MSHRLLVSKGLYVQETFEQLEQRYMGFGKGLYAYLKEHLPQVFSRLTFYKELNYQIKDSYAVYTDHDQTLGIQLDPEVNV